MTALRIVRVGPADVDADLVQFDDWQRDLRNLRARTISVRHDLLQRLSGYLGKPLREATEADLLAWERVAVAGRSAETRRVYVSHVRSFYRWAIRARILTEDPSTRLTNPRLDRPLPRPLPEDELRTTVAAARRPKLRTMILLAAFCGLRCQEIAGLHWSDLRTDDEAGAVVLLVREGKGGKERVVPVPNVVAAALNQLGRRRSGPLFYGVDGAQITPNAVSRSINRHFDRLGIDATAHQLRHRYGTTAYRLSKDLRMVQELLGHGSPTTTARYAAYDKSNEGAMVRAMDAAWTGHADVPPPAEDLTAVAEALRPAPEPSPSTAAPTATANSQPATPSASARPTVNDLGMLRPRGKR